MTITTDKSLIQIDGVLRLMGQSHWASKRTRETVIQTIEHSLCFSALENGQQVGFARVITDYCTFAYLCDVIVDESCRGRGIGKELMTAVMGHPDLANLRRFLLATKDAHGLYARYGFGPLPPDEQARFMGLPRRDEV